MIKLDLDTTENKGWQYKLYKEGKNWMEAEADRKRGAPGISDHRGGVAAGQDSG